MGRRERYASLDEEATIEIAGGGAGDEHARLPMPPKSPEDKINDILSTLTEEDLCRASLAYWARQTLSGPKEKPYNGRFFINAHHETWSDLLVHKKLALMAPRDSGKSHFFSLAYPIWRSLESGTEGYIFSANASSAERILRNIRQEVENNPKLQWLVPKNQDQRGKKSAKSFSQTRLEFSNGSSIIAKSAESATRGAHPDWYVLDDASKQTCAFSKRDREKLSEWTFSSCLGMLHPENSQMIVVGTPLHQNDIFHEFQQLSELSPPQFYFETFPAINPETGEPLWEERYSLERLEERRATLGSLRFSREYLCKAVSSANSLFAKEMTKNPAVLSHTDTLGMPVEHYQASGITAYMGVDLAISANSRADWFCCFLEGVHPRTGKHYVIDIVHEQGIGFTEQMRLITDLGYKYRPILQKIFIESNQYQAALTQQMVATTDLPIYKFTTTARKHDSTGIPGLRPIFENSRISIPRGDAQTRKLTDIWLDQMEAWSFDATTGKVVSVSEHDDLAMSFWIACQAAMQRELKFSFMDRAGMSERDKKVVNEHRAAEAQKNNLQRQFKLQTPTDLYNLSVLK